MSTNYAVFHTEKGTVSSAVIGRHIDRTEGAEYTYEHADPARKNLNIHFDLGEFTQMELHEAVEKRIEQGYQAKNKAGELKAIRKDAVKYNTHVLTGTHEQMKEIEESPQRRKEWIDANFEFIKKEFGEKNIVRFAVHRDEKTMHIHAVTVNLTKDGRLSAKEIIGNKKQMQQRQDRYANEMKPFGLERGIRSTGITHEGSREYYSRMKEALKEGDEKENLKVFKTFLGVQKGLDVENTVLNYENALKREKTAKNSLQMEISSLKKKFEENNNLKNHYFEKLKHSESNRKKENTENQEYIKKLQFSRIDLIFSNESEIQSFRKTYSEIIHSEMVDEVLGLKRKVSVQDYDRIIKNKMLSTFPDKDPWRMYENYFKINHQKKDSDLLWEVCKEINEGFEQAEKEKKGISQKSEDKELKINRKNRPKF